jgi:hypothetical protein
MAPETLNRNNSKWPEVKIIFIIDLFATNVLELYLVKDFYFKNAVLGEFSIKKYKLPKVCGGVSAYSGRLGVIYDSKANNGSAAGGGEHSQGVLPAS